jgi:hypothetical protein
MKTMTAQNEIALDVAMEELCDLVCARLEAERARIEIGILDRLKNTGGEPEIWAEAERLKEAINTSFVAIALQPYQDEAPHQAESPRGRGCTTAVPPPWRKPAAATPPSWATQKPAA